MKGSNIEGEELATKVAELLERMGGPDGEEAKRAKAVREPLDTACLERWVIARKGDLAHAERDLRKHIAWREANVPGGRLHPDCIETELKAEKVFLFGPTTRDGQAVTILLAAKHNASARNLEEVKRLIVYNIDLSRALCDPVKNPHRKVMAIIDLSNLGYNNLDSSGLLQVFKILQNHYPETLATMMMVNTPTIFSVIWAAVSPFIDQKTKSRIIFVKSANVTEALMEMTGKDMIPTIYGGDAELILLQKWGQDLFGEVLGDGKGTAMDATKEMNTDDL